MLAQGLFFDGTKGAALWENYLFISLFVLQKFGACYVDVLALAVVSVPVPVSGAWLTRTPSRQLAVALFYYAIVIDATVKMGQPRLYQKAPWVAQYRAHS